MPTRRVACYIRVSTENQLENYSIEEQTERLKAYCKAKDWAIYRVYTDGGYSGGNIDRPALQQLLSDIKKNLVDMVIVYKLDRLSRSQKDTLTLIEDQFLVNNIDFVSISENFDTSTPFGRAMIGILSVFAQLEKDQITERFTMGRIGRAKNGYYHGGPTAPTGYDYIDGKLVVNEYEAIQVQEVFEFFLKGKSITSIQKHMSNNYTNKYGSWSSHTLVLNILRNSTYIGKVKFKNQEYDGSHAPIISEDTFLQAQKLLTDPQREDAKNTYQKTPFKASNLLSSLIYCAHCGARFCGNHGNYVCYSRGKTDKRKIIDPDCMNIKWEIEQLDKIIVDKILELAYDEEFFTNLTLDQHEPEPDTARISDIDKQISRMIDLYQIGDISLDQISDRIDGLKKEKEAIIKGIENHEKSKMTVSEARQILYQVKEVFSGNDLPHKRLLVSSLIERISIDNLHIDIKWRFL